MTEMREGGGVKREECRHPPNVCRPTQKRLNFIFYTLYLDKRIVVLVWDLRTFLSPPTALLLNSDSSDTPACIIALNPLLSPSLPHFCLFAVAGAAQK